VRASRVQVKPAVSEVEAMSRPRCVAAATDPFEVDQLLSGPP